MPHLPIVHVADSLRVGIVFKVGAGGTRPVRHRLSILDNHIGQHAIEKNHVVLPDLLRRFLPDCRFELLTVSPMHPSGFNFVVAAPNHDAGMVPQTLYLIDRLLPHIVEKCSVARIHVAAEHKVLPDNESEFVADVVEVVVFVDPASPLADHVHIGVARGLKDLAIRGLSDSGGKTVERNYICAFSKNGNAIDHELHASAPVVRIAPQHQ